MSFLGSLFGGRPAIPSVSDPQALVEWFVQYDEKTLAEIDNSYGKDVVRILPELVAHIAENNTAELMLTHVARLMGQHNMAIIVLANNGQLDYAFTPGAASLKLTCAKIRIHLRIIGYLLLKKYNVNIGEIPAIYPDEFGIDDVDFQELATKSPSVIGLLF